MSDLFLSLKAEIRVEEISIPLHIETIIIEKLWDITITNRGAIDGEPEGTTMQTPSIPYNIHCNNYFLIHCIVGEILTHIPEE